MDLCNNHILFRKDTKRVSPTFGGFQNNRKKTAAQAFRRNLNITFLLRNGGSAVFLLSMKTRGESAVLQWGLWQENFRAAR